MASSVSSLSSNSSASVASGFVGTSTFATQFQNEISRQVAIASLPISQLQSDQTALNSQATELGALDAKFTALQTAVQAINTAVSGSSFNADISDPESLSATVSDGATEGNYSVQIDNIGAYATSLTSSAWVVSGAPKSYQLVVGAQSFQITPTDNSAASVVSAINSQAGSLVQATVVNVGSSASPDYRIALQNRALGDAPVDLQLNGASLQIQQTVGALAEYEVNGSGMKVSSTSRTALISPGLTVQLQASTDSPVNITLTRSSTALANALSSFATAYNDAVDEVDAQRGQNAGPLQGQQIVFDLGNALGTIGTYGGDGAFGGLASLGLVLGPDGHFTFDQSTLLGADFASSSAVNSFLGSVTNGGFLHTITNTLSSLEDPNTGVIKTTESEYQKQSAQMQSQISARQQQVAILQTNLVNQMSQADSLIASMQSQYSYLTAVFDAQQTASKQIANG